MCILNELFFDGKSDGMVMVDAQREIELQVGMDGLKSDILTSAHHDVGSNDRVFNDVLHIVDDTIDEHNDKQEKMNLILKHIQKKIKSLMLRIMIIIKPLVIMRIVMI